MLGSVLVGVGDEVPSGLGVVVILRRRQDQRGQVSWKTHDADTHSGILSSFTRHAEVNGSRQPDKPDRRACTELIQRPAAALNSGRKPDYITAFQCLPGRRGSSLSQ